MKVGSARKERNKLFCEVTVTILLELVPPQKTSNSEDGDVQRQLTGAKSAHGLSMKTGGASGTSCLFSSSFDRTKLTPVVSPVHPPTSLRPVRISRLYNGTYRIPKKAHQQLFLNFARVPIFLSIHVEKINRSAPPSLSCRFVAVILCTVRYIYSQQGRGRLKILTCSASPGRVRHLQPHQVDGAAWARKLVT